jgi:hypothetical protein
VVDDAWKLEFDAEPPSAVSNLMGEVIDDRLSRKMSANQRAATAWYRANGDRERAHTTGVFLKRARIAGAPPILGVYVDSHAMATDFGVNKDIYLARLANVGFEVSGIEFVPSREGYRRARKDDADVRRSSGAQPLPELDDTERETVESLVSDLPESLRASASKAVSLSLRREKSERANKHR